MRKVQTWFDIWGLMQGGTNDAMATGLSVASFGNMINRFL